MYVTDAAGRRVPRTERTAFRATHLRPLMDEFFKPVAAARDLTPGRNLATKALGYAINLSNPTIQYSVGLRGDAHLMR